jgi:hypothetical protein
MSVVEAAFWVGITLFGTGLYFMFESKTKNAKKRLGVILMCVGLGGMAFSIVKHFRNQMVTAVAAPVQQPQPQPQEQSQQPSAAPNTGGQQPQTQAKPKQKHQSASAKLQGNDNTQQQQEQNNSGGTNTQQQSTGDQSPNVNCPNGICAGRDINGNPTVNNYGPPPPKLAWHKVDNPTPPISAFGDVVVSLSLDRVPGTLAFTATCDKPCSSGGAMAVTPGTFDLREFINETSSNSNRAIVLMVPERPIGAGQEILWSIRSTGNALAAGTPLVVKNVEVIPEEEAGKLSRRPNQILELRGNPLPH